MNKFKASLATTEADFIEADLQAIAMAHLFGSNITPIESATAGVFDLVFDLPFSLSNIDHKVVKTAIYASSSQDVNEYSDRPYPKKGLLAVCSVSTADVSKAQKELDNYVKYTAKVNTGGTPVDRVILVGVCNNSQTEFYTPFNGLNAVFYEIPAEGLDTLMTAALAGAADQVSKVIADEAAKGGGVWAKHA